MTANQQTVKVRKYGYIKIPSDIISKMGIRENSRLNISIENDNIILSKYEELTEILKRIDALEKTLTENSSSINTKHWKKCLRCITTIKNLFAEKDE